MELTKCMLLSVIKRAACTNEHEEKNMTFAAKYAYCVTKIQQGLLVL